MKDKCLPSLKEIALLGALANEIAISSSELSLKIGISQQAASQHIISLLNEGLIKRSFGRRKQYLAITQKGRDVLRKEYADYMRIFGTKKEITIKGEIASGLGEGRYYISQKGYQKQFKERLGFKPYEGTLNVKVNKNDIVKLDILHTEKGMMLDGFKESGRTFGTVKIFPAELSDVSCMVLMPARSHYSDVLEIISEKHLRSALSLNEGDEIELRVMFS